MLHPDDATWDDVGGERDDDDEVRLLQVVNFASEAQQVDVELLGLHTSPQMMTVTVLNSTNGLSENSFDEPFMVSLVQKPR